MQFKNSFLVTKDNRSLIGTVEVNGKEKAVPNSKLVLKNNGIKYVFKLNDLKFLMLKNKIDAFTIYCNGKWFQTDSSNYIEFKKEWLKCIFSINEVKA